MAAPSSALSQLEHTSPNPTSGRRPQKSARLLAAAITILM